VSRSAPELQRTRSLSGPPPGVVRRARSWLRFSGPAVAVARVVGVIAVCGAPELALSSLQQTPLARVVIVAVVGLLGLWMPLGVILAGAILSVRTLAPIDIVGDISGSDLLIMLVIARLVARMISSDSLPISVPSQWLLLFTLWLWFTTVIAEESVTPILRLTVYAFLSIVLAAQSSPRTKNVYLIFGGYAVFELIVSIPAELPGRVLGSTIGDPHQLSILCLAALAPLLAAARTFTFPGRRLLIAFLVVGVLLTRTRGAWGALLVLLVVSQMSRLSGKRLVAILVSFATAGLILYGPVTQAFGLYAQSKSIREETVLRGMRAGIDSPFVGVGWDAELGLLYAPPKSQVLTAARTQPFNVFVSVFAFTGIPGLILWVGFLAHLLRLAIARCRAGFLFLSAFLAFSLSEMTIYAGALGTIIFFVYAGIAQRRPEGGPASLPSPSGQASVPAVASALEPS